MLRLTLEAEMPPSGCMSLPPPEPAKMLSWMEPWREDCSLVVTDSRNAKPENELLGQMTKPTRPCAPTRTPSRPAATAPSPMTLLPGRTSPSQLVTPAGQGKPPAASARPTAMPPPSTDTIQMTAKAQPGRARCQQPCQHHQ